VTVNDSVQAPAAGQEDEMTKMSSVVAADQEKSTTDADTDGQKADEESTVIELPIFILFVGR